MRRHAASVLSAAAAVLLGVTLAAAGFWSYAELHGLPVWDVVRARVGPAALGAAVVGVVMLSRVRRS